MKIGTFLSTVISICLLFSGLSLQGCQNKAKKETAPAKQAAAGKAEKTQKDAGYIYGKVKETMDSGGYTYMLLEFEGKDFWVAVPGMKIAAGEEIMLLPGDTMKNFHSNSLNRTFETIIFSQGPASGQAMQAGTATKAVKKPHTGRPELTKKKIHIKPAQGKDAVTVEAAHKKAAKLDGKQVVLRAQVVKVSKNILGKNWLHVQDGTGSQADRNFDLTVTTLSAPKLGADVLIKGTLHANRDIGAGYFYPVIIEDANVIAD